MSNINLIPANYLKHAIALLEQQCWCWGRDILRPEGNWLLEIGFERFESPVKREQRPSVYQLSLPGDRLVILRGFGVFWGRSEFGGVFLPRSEFTPSYTEYWKPDFPPWTKEGFPSLEVVNASNQSRSALLLLELIDWIYQYELEIVESLGLHYRIDSLVEWQSTKHKVIPAEKIAPQWQQLSSLVAEHSNSLLVVGKTEIESN